MSDASKPSVADHKRISSDEEYWSRKFSVNPGQIRAAAQKRRGAARAVERSLNERSAPAVRDHA